MNPVDMDLSDEDRAEIEERRYWASKCSSETYWRGGLPGVWRCHAGVVTAPDRNGESFCAAHAGLAEVL